MLVAVRVGVAVRERDEEIRDSMEDNGAGKRYSYTKETLGWELVGCWLHIIACGS